MDVSGFRTEYVPGQGYFGYFSGHDKPMVRWGKEFLAMVEEQAANRSPNPNKSPLDRTSNLPVPFDPLAGPFERKILTKDELNKLATELAAKYDPTNMTQEEYDSLLFELVDQGILCENDLGVMGLHGHFALGYGWSSGSFGVSTETLHSNPYYQRYGSAKSLYDTNGNALAYASLVALFKPGAGNEAWRAYAETKQSSHEALANVLEAVQRKRQALGLDGESDNTSNARAGRSLNNGPTWAEAMARWKDGSNSSDSLEEEVEDVRNDMYAALDNVLEASMERRRLALRRG